MKATRSNRKITPHGGAVPVLKKLNDFKIPQLIRECLGTRVKQAKYSYEDVIIAWILTSLCGGKRLDHITKLRKSLDIIPGLKLPSHDTLGRVMKSMATEIISDENVSRSKRGYAESKRKGSKTYKRVSTKERNEHEPLNNLLVMATVAAKVLRPNVKYDLDIDATAIQTEVREAKKTYKKYKGFSPMVACIDKMPVFIEMRGGNVAPNSRVFECTEKCINNLKANNVKVGRISMDAGGFNGEVFDFLEREKIKFCIGAVQSKRMMELVKKCEHWTPQKIKTTLFDWECETADIDYELLQYSGKYRLVVLRIDRTVKGTPSGWIYGGKYAYKIIITNDHESSAQELISFYNQRGTREQNFSTLKNSFGWKYPPFSTLNENNVFILIAALCNNLYQGIIHALKKHVKDIRLNAGLADFIYTFMTVACEILDDAVIFYDTKIPFEKIC